MATKNNYELLIGQLDQFIRKYYVNQLIRGVLYSIGLVLLLFITMNVLEYNFYFSPGVRKLLFYSFLGISGLALTGWVILPLLHYFRLGQIISHKKAAQIIGEHFTDVKDKLLNVLQLKEQANTTQSDLLLASINQKTESIKLVPFQSAIDLGKNRKYLRYALPPLLLLLVILFAAPSIITDGTTRLINNDKNFERPALFSYEIKEDALTVVQFDDYLLDVKVTGEVYPNEVFIDIDNYQYRLVKEAADHFTYRFSNVQKDMAFSLFSSGVTSDDFTLKVLKKPNVAGFEIKLDYPAYTGRKDENLANIGDVVVPAGTKIDWVFNAQNTDAIIMRFSGMKEMIETKRFDNTLFTYQKTALKDEAYKLYVSNKDLPNADSIGYSIGVIPDGYPSINVQKFADSTDAKLFYFVGEASDDYGLLNLSFNYRLKNEKEGQGELTTIKLQKPKAKQIQYEHIWDVNDLALKPGDEITYYFEVFDNDGINGSKSARTNLMIYAMPTVDEFEAMASEKNEDIKDNLKKSLEDVKKAQEEMKKLREKLLQEKEMDWQNRKDLEKMLEQHKNLQEQIEDAKKDFEENLKNQEEFTEVSEELQEKQEKLQEMFEELVSDEMKEMMEKIQEMLEELEKEGALEKMEEMELNDEELEKELDRMMELFKQLEMEYELQKQIDALEELAEEQEELSEEVDKEEKSQEELQKEQEEINEKFDELQEKMEELEKKNEELENPKELGDDNKEEMEDIEKDLDKSEEQLEQKQNSKASKSQKSAAQKMKDMAMKMSESMESGEMEQMEEDMQALRQLLENLIELSFSQEGLIGDVKQAKANTPHYVDLVQDQYKLKDDFRLIEDTLQALSKRVIQIESFVTEKVTEIKSNMKSSLKQLEGRSKSKANEHQQYTMKNVNDLALMLSEVMDQMQQQMSSMMSGSQMCNKPGGKGSGGKEPKDKMSQGQQSLNQQMEQMKKALEKGGKGGKGGMSKEFAQMAAKQAALRKGLRELQKEKQQQGKGSKELQEIIDQMDEIETDLVNKKLTNEMMKRQEEILTRLLESERAEREREYDNKRKSETGNDKEKKLPPSVEEYIKKREAEIEMFKTVSPSLRPYYKNLVEEYFKSLKKE